MALTQAISAGRERSVRSRNWTLQGNVALMACSPRKSGDWQQDCLFDIFRLAKTGLQCFRAGPVISLTSSWVQLGVGEGWRRSRAANEDDRPFKHGGERYLHSRAA